MASIVTNILSGGALAGISKVIDSIRGRSPEDAAKLQELLTKHEDTVLQVNADLEKAKMQENVSLNETAGQNIRAEQNDKYTARSRPTVIYAWIAVVLYNYIVTSLIGKQPVIMPDMFWEVSGIVITGYVFARTGDKLFGGNGGSMQLPFGVKINSQGDK
jgi:hypothetical protein